MISKKKISEELDNQYYKIAVISHNLKQISLDYSFLNINLAVIQNLYKNPEKSIEEILIDSLSKDKEILLIEKFEMLFRPDIKFDMLSFLKEKSRTQKYAIIWPGTIKNDMLIYSRQGRPDFYKHKIDNYLIYKDM